MDLNAEAIQICQLSLWIKTAARGKQLTSLDHTIREGNSVISDPAVHPKAFDWHAAFPWLDISALNRYVLTLVRPENQFSLTRAALSTGGRGKSKFLSVHSRLE